MKSTLRRLSLFPCLILLASGCQADAALEPQGIPPALTIGDGCTPPYLTSGILEPINADGSTSIQLGRTLPVKIRIWDCATHAGVNTLAPEISLAFVDPETGGEPVDLISSSAADNGTTMRSAGDGQYIFNLSTKRSQFNDGRDLRPGTYELTISLGGEFTAVVVQFIIRP